MRAEHGVIFDGLVESFDEFVECLQVVELQRNKLCFLPLEGG